MLAVVVIYVVVSLSSDREDKETIVIETNNASTTSKYMSTTEYAGYIEDKIVSLVSNIEGIGKVAAMVSLYGSSTFNYMIDSSISHGSDNIIFVESGGERYPLVVSESLPKVTGVVIVCQGLTSTTKVDIVRSVSSMFELSTDKVYVLKG